MNNVRVWNLDEEIRSTKEHIKQLENSMKEGQALRQEGRHPAVTSVEMLKQVLESLRNHLEYMEKLMKQSQKA